MLQPMRKAAYVRRIPVCPLMRRTVIAVSIVLCSLLTNGCSKAIARATAATVFSVNGGVAFGIAEQNNFQPVTLKSRIHDGDSVRAANGASVDLGLIPGAFAQLCSDSEIKIEELRITKDGNETAGDMRERRARIRVIRGKLIVLFIPSDTNASGFVITAPGVTVKPDSDCLFSVWTDGTTTRVTCAKEKVIASANEQRPVTIAVGYFQRWPTRRNEPVVAASDASAQIDITESLQAGDRLLEQASSWQKRRPF
jgi:hypothetical protein